MIQQTPPTPQSPRPGPSRDMIGGPWLGVTVFVLIAIGLGWGLIQLFEQMVDQTTQTLSKAEFDHGFDPEVVYTLKRDLLVGYLADGRQTLLPGKEDLPRGVPGRRSAATLEAFRKSPDDYPDLIGIVERKTRVRFVEVVDDRDNPQTRVLVMVRLLDGPYARQRPVVGLHLESADTPEGSEKPRYIPRPDLFEPVEPEQGPVQSPAPQPEPQ